VTAKKRILHPTDFSPAAEPAFEYALHAAKRDDATLVLMHVIEPISPLADEVYVALKHAAREATEKTARTHFDSLLARAKTADVEAFDLLRDGRPAEEIVNAAVSDSADLIVMGTHGRRGLRRFVVGSVAQQVVASAPCPVVTVRMKTPEA
jgi:nucleotide-binding universal stress UspA family protein